MYIVYHTSAKKKKLTLTVYNNVLYIYHLEVYIYMYINLCGKQYYRNDAMGLKNYGEIWSC